MAGCIQVVGEAAQDQDQLEATTIVPAGETAQDRPQVLCEGIPPHFSLAHLARSLRPIA